MPPDKTPRERAEDLIRLLVPDWRPTPQQGLWAIRVAFVAGVLFAIGYAYDITLWDWIKLLVVPAVIAGGGLWFNRQQRDRELETARQQREREVEIAERRTQDEALQAYLDQMSAMLIPNADQPSLYKARPGDSLSSVARARTLTVLPRLDGERKARVVQFLYESGLIAMERPVLDLQGADLSGANLSSANLGSANLYGANLEGAELGWAELSTANLRKADLSRANLHQVKLEGASLDRANLSGANLSRANLEGASLSRANLEGASLDRAILARANLYYAELKGAHLKLANLEEARLEEASLEGANLYGANLYGANLRWAILSLFTNLEGADLEQAHLEGSKATEKHLAEASSLEGATMPDRQTLRGDLRPNSPTFEDWLKDKKAREENVENE